MKKILQKFFRGYAVLEEINSPINGKIQVWEDWFSKKRLVVSGISQSGEPVEKIWNTAIKQLSNLAIKNCLILGLGAGSAARLISQKWPGVKIIGIEIDPEMIRLGKKYFGLVEVENLEVKIEDALSCSNDPPAGEAGLYHDSRKFDLVLVDLYLGDQVPAGAETDEFIKRIQKCLSSKGIVIFNRLYYEKKKEKTDKFGEKLEKIFAKIEAKKTSTNKLFLCQK